MKKINGDIAVATNTFDSFFNHFVQELGVLGWRVYLHQLPGQKVNPNLEKLFAGRAPRLEKAAANGWPVYVAIDPSADQTVLEGIDFPALQGKAVIDLARGSLNVNRDEEKRLRGVLPFSGHNLVLRDGRQLGETGGDHAAVLCCRDYLKYQFIPRHIITDILWLILRTKGLSTTEQAPSSYFQQLLLAPLSDVSAMDLARKVAAMDSFAAPALLRQALPTIAQTQQIAQDLQAAVNRCPLGWLYYSAILSHMPPDSPLAQAIGANNKNLLPRPLKAKGESKRILLFVMRKQRDLFIDLILRYWLEYLGHEVHMRPIGDAAENSILELLPDMIIWGGPTTRRKVELARFARQRNILSVVRREEVGYSYEIWAKRTATEREWWLGHWNYSPFVELELFQHPDCAAITSAEGHMTPDLSGAVGSLVMDPYNLPNLQKWLPPKEEMCRKLGIDPNKKNMILATRWTYADRDPKTAIPEALTKEGRAANEIPEVKKRIDMCLQGRKDWLELIKLLHGRFGDEWNIILKVHPGEKPDEYKNFIAARNLNTPVILDGYMVEILPHMDLLLHCASTTSMEAHYLGIPAFGYKDPDPNALPISRLTPLCDSFEELATAIDNVELGRSNADMDVLSMMEKEFYGVIDGKACWRAAKKIDSLARGAAIKPHRFPSDKYQEGFRTNYDPYGQNISDIDIERYYPVVKGCLDEMDKSEYV